MNQYSFSRKNPFAFPPKDCALLQVDSFSRQDEITVFRSNSQLTKAVSFWKSVEARAGNQPYAGVLSQSASSNHALSWLPKVPSRSWLRKNALCLSQSAFSNFALYVISICTCHKIYRLACHFFVFTTFWRLLWAGQLWLNLDSRISDRKRPSGYYWLIASAPWLSNKIAAFAKTAHLFGSRQWDCRLLYHMTAVD